PQPPAAQMPPPAQIPPPAGPGAIQAPEAHAPAAPPPPDPDFAGTVVIPMALVRPVGSEKLGEAGELIEVSAHHPFLLDEPDIVWHVVEGGVMIFAVALDKGEPVGPRTHFLGVLPGQVMFGFDLQRYGVGSGFL